MTNTSNNSKTVLILIDVQNDFHPGGSLAVANADQDSKRIASLIRRSINQSSSSSSIDRIICTMDTHNTLHIANPGFWISGEDYFSMGKMTHPIPFTTITSEEVKSKKWIPRPDVNITQDKLNLIGHIHLLHSNIIDCFDKDQQIIDVYKWCIKYTEMLEKDEDSDFKLTIWPEHCLIGTEGWCMVKEVRDAVREWEMSTGKTAEFVCKGFMNWTEMYSVVKASVPVCIYTSFNDDLFAVTLPENSTQVLICGQASSHCVNFTTRHLVKQMPESDRSKVVVLIDCTSPVTGCEVDAEKFICDMKATGVRCIASTKVLLE